MSSVPFRQMPRGDMRKRVPVTVVVGLSPQDELFILIDDEAIERAESEERAELERGLQELGRQGLSEVDIQSQRLGFAARRAAWIAQYKRERDAALPCARWLDYVLVLPLLKDWQRILNEAFTPENGSTDWNPTSEQRYRELLLLNNGVETPDGRVFSEADLANLHPVIADALGNWIGKILYSDPRKKMLVAPNADTAAIAVIQSRIDTLNKGK